MSDVALDITGEMGDPVITGDPGTGIILDPCRCPDAHETPDGACDQFLPEVHGKNRIRCDGCQRDGGWIHKPTPKSKDKGPTINIKVPGTPGVKSSGLTKDQQRVLEAGTAWLGLAAGVLAASGDTVCAEAIQAQAPQIAMQLALLAKYHPIIVKMLAPVEASGEAVIWISLLVAVSPVMLTVLMHHKVISEEVAARIGIVTALGAVVGQAKPEEEAAA